LKIISRIFEGICLFSLLVFLFVGFVFPYQNTGVQFEKLVSMNEGWDYRVNDKLVKNILNYLIQIMKQRLGILFLYPEYFLKHLKIHRHYVFLQHMIRFELH